jgi:hypothetical protein
LVEGGVAENALDQKEAFLGVLDGLGFAPIQRKSTVTSPTTPQISPPHAEAPTVRDDLILILL